MAPAPTRTHGTAPPSRARSSPTPVVFRPRRRGSRGGRRRPESHSVAGRTQAAAAMDGETGLRTRRGSGPPTSSAATTVAGFHYSPPPRPLLRPALRGVLLRSREPQHPRLMQFLHRPHQRAGPASSRRGIAALSREVVVRRPEAVRSKEGDAGPQRPVPTAEGETGVVHVRSVGQEAGRCVGARPSARARAAVTAAAWAGKCCSAPISGKTEATEAHISISSQGAQESRAATPGKPLKARPHQPHPALPGRLTNCG